MIFLRPDGTGSYGRKTGISSALRSWASIWTPCRTPHLKEAEIDSREAEEDAENA
jgi:hypothetical protein